MGLTWTTWAIPGILASLVAWAAVIVLLRTAPERPLNRRLAVVLSLEGTWSAGAIFFMVEDPAVFMRVSGVAVGAMAALPFQYLSFLGVALDTPLVRPFRSRTALVILGLASAVAGSWVLFSPSTFIGELYSPEWATWNFRFGSAGTAVAQVHGLASLFGLAAALWAWFRTAPGTAARSRAKWFAIAFGVRDVFAASTYLLYPVVSPYELWRDALYNLGTATILLVYVALMAYGVLRVQLFDLDLKLKFALKQSTVGAVIAAGFFTGSEVLEAVVPVEGTILGLLVAGSIVLLLRPVQRFAESVASGIMPGVEGTPAYLESRKQEVYRAALEGAIEDGVVTGKERAILDRLREQLEIPAQTAETLEREMAGALPGGA